MQIKNRITMWSGNSILGVLTPPILKTGSTDEFVYPCHGGVIHNNQGVKTTYMKMND